MNIFETWLDSPAYKQFQDYLKEKYPNEYEKFSIEDVQDKFEVVFMMGLRKSREFLKLNLSCNILYNDKPPRADMMQKLGNILYELEDIKSYPIIPPLTITTAIKKVLSSRDNRTKEKYLKWIVQYSHHKRGFNSIDLTSLVEMFPKSLVKPGGLF